MAQGHEKGCLLHVGHISPSRLLQSHVSPILAVPLRSLRELAFELSLMYETRELEVLESYEQGASTSRAHSLVIEVCERNVSAKYQREG